MLRARGWCGAGAVGDRLFQLRMLRGAADFRRAVGDRDVELGGRNVHMAIIGLFVLLVLHDQFLLRKGARVYPVPVSFSGRRQGVWAV